MTQEGPRVGVIGARRARTGVGAFVARDLAAAGARVASFVATSPETRDATARSLGERFGIQARGYLDVDAMLGRERLDAVAILSPSETHERYLESALEAGLHVLCEKPILWGGAQLGPRAARIGERYSARGLALFENCQWPYVLPAYEALLPGSLGHAPERFEMRLQPSGGGAKMLGDSAPHALSLLQAIVPGDAPGISSISFSTSDPDPEQLVAEFVYATELHRTPVRLVLRRTDAHPRECAFGLDGRLARREVDADYAISFACEGRRVPVPDPMTQLVAEFTARLRSGDTTGDAARVRRIAARSRLLESLVEAYAAFASGAGGR